MNHNNNAVFGNRRRWAVYSQLKLFKNEILLDVNTYTCKDIPTAFYNTVRKSSNDLFVISIKYIIKSN